MGIFGFGTKSSSSVKNRAQIVARYERLRPLRLRLNNTIVSRLSDSMLKEGAKRLDMLRRGMLVFNTEDETSVLMDYCIYDVYRNGRNAVDQYLCDFTFEPDSEELAILRAMQHATYALVVVRRIEPSVGCHVENLFTDEMRFLVDKGFSQSAKRGLVLATRLLDFGDFVTTSGAPLPVGVLDDDELKKWQQKLREAKHDDTFDPASLIRRCLHKGASANIKYADELAPHGGSKFETLPNPRKPAQRKRPVVSRRGETENRRCRCGSGKMFKNCCGKR